MALHLAGLALAAWSVIPVLIVITWAAWPTHRTEVRK
jgi:hypothetical protein